VAEERLYLKPPVLKALLQGWLLVSLVSVDHSLTSRLTIQKFMYHSEVNLTETKMLHEDQVVFILHFLGFDTNGHSKKPHSK